MLSDEMVWERAVRLAARLPSSAPVLPVVFGAVKSRLLKSVQVPVTAVIVLAFVLYWKSSRSTRPVAPRRHCSPVYAMSSEVIVAPVLLVNDAPIVGMSDPL